MEYIHRGLLLSHKKWNNAICSNMDGPRDYHTLVTSERQISCDTSYMWNLKCDTNELIYQTEIDSLKTYDYQRQGKG